MSLQAAFFLFVAWGAVSCSTPAHITYFQDLRPGESEQQVVAATEIKVRPADKLSIIVNSRDPLLSDLFNLPISSPGECLLPAPVRGYPAIR